MKIIDLNSNPERSVYVLGSKLIELLKDKRFKKADTLSLFDELNRDKKHTPYSLEQFMLGLDWLFLLGLVAPEKNGDIFICF